MAAWVARPLLALALLLAAPAGGQATAAAASTRLQAEHLRLLAPARMGGFTLRALWETRYPRPVGEHPAGEVWRVEALYDFADGAAPQGEAGRALPDAAPPGCPPRRDHGIPVTLTATWGGEAPPACGGGRRGGDAVPLLDGCATLRRNVGDRAHTEGAWALEWHEAGADFVLRLGLAAERLPDARQRLLAAGAEARGWGRRLAGGAPPDEAGLARQRSALAAALAAGRAESAAPASCQPR